MSESFIIVPNAPSGLEFGINCISYELGIKFKGISMVPTGLHFIYHNIGFGMRQGFFIRISSKVDVVILPWNNDAEEILPVCDLSNEAIENLYGEIAQGLLNENLGAYSFSQHHNWLNLSSFITSAVLTRASCSELNIIYGESANEGEVSSSSESIKHLATFIDIHSAEVGFNELTNKTSTDKQLLTTRNLDKSDFLDHLIGEYYSGSWNDLLGEMQLSFLLFVLLYSYSALNHWKKLVTILCKSKRILRTNPKITVKFLRALYEQLNYIPTDFFTAEFSRDNFLAPALGDLFQNLGTDSTANALSEAVEEACARLLAFVRKRFSLFESFIETSGSILGSEYEFSADDDDLPAIVSEEELGEYRKEVMGSISTVLNSRRVGVISDQITQPDESIVKIKWNAIDAQLPNLTNQLFNQSLSIDNSITRHPDDTCREAAVDMDVDTSLSFLSAQELQYNWRYPLLYDAMRSTNGREDLLMTATRLIDESSEMGGSNMSAVVKEAYLFVEFEASHLTF